MITTWLFVDRFSTHVNCRIKICMWTDKKGTYLEYADSLPCKIKNAADFNGIMHNLCAIFLRRDAL